MLKPDSGAKSFDLTTLASVQRSCDALGRHPSPLPEFQHKWTGEKRCYRWDELAPPRSVFLRGAPPASARRFLAVGGTRSPTVEAFCLAARLVRRVAESGAAVVSGGVPGIDLAAHMAALDAPDGQTFAVLANPVERGLDGHEWSNRLLERHILATGGFISEYGDFAPFGSETHRERLLQRDRIISGMSDVFVAFECSVGSATVDTALRALSQGKPVFVVRASRPTTRAGTDFLSRDQRVMSFQEGVDPDQVIVDALVNALETHRTGRRAG